MRQISLFVLLVFSLSSCGLLSPTGGKLRYVKADKNTIVVVDRSNQNDVIVDAVESKPIPTVENGRAENNEKLTQATDLVIESASTNGNENLKVNESTLQPQDLNPDEDERIIQEAYEAERAANTSFILLLIGLVSAIAPYLGIIPFLIGIYFYTKSDRSRYITQFGERKQQSAKVVLIIDTVILALWLLLIVALFFL